jgi:hypothetical protein
MAYTPKTSLVKRLLTMFVVVVQLAFYPAASVYAAESDSTDVPADTTTTQQETPEETSAPDPGPTQPNGADSQTYHENPDGTWSNDYYTWDPVTKQTSPNTSQDYSYNPETGMWDTVQYRYDAPSGKYVPNVVSSPQNPNQPNSGAPTQTQAVAASGNDPSNTGPNSNNTSNSTTNNNGFFNGFLNVQITNTIGSSAHTGNASVIQNTNGGDAISGDAETIANILNMLQSSWDPSNGDPAVFRADINGDVNGDLLLDPDVIDTTGPNSVNTTNSTTNNNLQVNAQANGTINNNINLDASSGDATVAGNTNGGNAKSGDAKTVVNLINMINSAIAAKRSFVGVLNINGNLNGDILLPDWLLQSLVQNTGPNSNNTSNQTDNTTINANLTDNQTINNNLDSDASSGTANVSNNTSGGSATTGSANTNVTVLNLTGKKVDSKNAILVFVNVFGKWVGLILDKPAGTTSALLANTGPNSNNASNSTTNTNVDIDETSNNTINNNLDLHAETGDASVTGNTSGGNATSGDAYVGANIANIMGSELNIGDWFGVLFINVFGSWVGSFGVNTAAGNAPAAAAAAPNANTGNSPLATAVPKVFNFIAAHAGSDAQPQTDTAVNGTTGTAVLASSTGSNKTASQGSQPTVAAISTDAPHANFWWAVGGVSFALTLLGIERYLTFRKR